MTRSLDQALIQGADVSALASMNLFVNGFHLVNQEYGQGSGVTSGKFPADQFQITSPSAGFYGNQVATPFPSQPDIPLAIKLTAPSVGALGAGDNILLYQQIEGINLGKLGYGSSKPRPITIAFMVNASYTGVGGFSLYSFNTPVRSFVKRFAFTAGQDTLVYFTVPGDVAVLLTTNVASIQARWCFGTGSTFQTTNVEAWQAGNFLGTSDVTNLAGVANQTVTVGACVMLPGIVPISQAILPSLARPYDDELRKCQRYYEAGSFVSGGPAISGAGTLVPIYFRSIKRVVPTLGWVNTYNTGVGTYDVRNPALDSCYVYTIANTNGGWGYNGTYSANARM